MASAMKEICVVGNLFQNGVFKMEDRFLEDILDNFFNTGILKCSVYQLNAIYTLTRKKILENNGETSEEKRKWMSLSRMLFTYLTETQACITTVNENLKVNFNEYLGKVYGVSIGEIPAENIDYIYERYISFIVENCCDKCLSMLSPDICKTCKCGEIWNKSL